MSRLHWMRNTAASALMAGAVALGAQGGANAADPELMLKALGTTEGSARSSQPPSTARARRSARKTARWH